MIAWTKWFHCQGINLVLQLLYYDELDVVKFEIANLLFILIRITESFFIENFVKKYNIILSALIKFNIILPNLFYDSIVLELLPILSLVRKSKFFVWDSHFLSKTESQFLSETESHFLSKTESHFLSETESHFCIRQRDTFLYKTESHFYV